MADYMKPNGFFWLIREIKRVVGQPLPKGPKALDRKACMESVNRLNDDVERPKYVALEGSDWDAQTGGEIKTLEGYLEVLDTAIDQSKEQKDMLTQEIEGLPMYHTAREPGEEIPVSKIIELAALFVALVILCVAPYVGICSYLWLTVESKITAISIGLAPLAIAIGIKLFGEWLDTRDRARFVRTLLIVSAAFGFIWTIIFGAAFGDQIFASGADIESQIGGPWLGRVMLAVAIPIESMTAGALLLTISKVLDQFRNKKTNRFVARVSIKICRVGKCIRVMELARAALIGRIKAMEKARDVHTKKAEALFNKLVRRRDWFNRGDELGDEDGDNNGDGDGDEDTGPAGMTPSPA